MRRAAVPGARTGADLHDTGMGRLVVSFSPVLVDWAGAGCEGTVVCGEGW